MRLLLTATMALTLMFLVPTTSFGQTPNWVKEFRQIVGNMSYSKTQPSLRELHKTRQGNCVAFSKLGAEIAMRQGLVCEALSVGHEDESGSPRNIDRHRLTLIHDHDGRLWCVSNDEIYRVRNQDDAIGWTFNFGSFNVFGRRGSFTLDFNDDDWELKHKHTFTKHELEEDFE